MQAFLEKHHIDHLRFWVTPTRICARQEVESTNVDRLQSSFVFAVKFADSSQRSPTYHRTLETDLEVAVESWDAAEYAQDRLCHKDAARRYAKRLSYTLAETPDRVDILVGVREVNLPRNSPPPQSRGQRAPVP